MSTVALPRDALMPRPPGGMRRGLALAVAAHLLLVAALSFSVKWNTQVPDSAEAELWASVPQVAAPRAAEPPPAAAAPRAPSVPPPRVERAAPPPAPTAPPATREVPDAQIALERARQAEQRREDEAQRRKEALRVKAEAKEKAKEKETAREKELAEKERAQASAEAASKLKAAREAKAAKDSKEAARQIEAQAERLEAQREANLRRIIGQAGGSSAPRATGAAAVNMAPSADYIGRIKGRIRPNVSFPNTLPGNPAVEIEVRVAADGRIMSTRVLKPSGAQEWDDAVLRAIDKTEVLPRDENGRVPPAFVLVYRPRD